MIPRRKLLITACVGVSATLAGCADNDQPEQTDDEETDTQPTDGDETDEPSSETLQKFSLVAIRSFSHTFSDGLSVDVELRNETEGGTGEDRARVSMEAYAGEELLGEDAKWKRVGSSGAVGTYELAIEAISPSGDESIDNVTEVRILASEEEGQNIVLETFSGDDIRSRVE